ncbi:DUF4337 family protein [Chromobacterium subtsugae]|mgnify:CR=1 FL=1|uniref:DUF4337 family protein n=1 Tax=Chromobacterium subtsugae TaxID=251747 RepID=A0ABS7F9A4_9NEIS|nr:MULTISPECIES: DUF4337 domain-containing protein [Chromobacterium]KUM04471.1 hypothetical protein Cv017_14380 [Chromobacterium subtsugae]KZE86089.1 hypothetical protein AWB61_17595 [Chromobacterium sp. F49]MBW7564887.1 DUF4337 domain-containing protein [Chromobacterium subtsugae]MBW8286586.1 DUF4337 family protein [Chromobacterium subtsugae]OBU85052.1 membrane protein [Chromobacterium subtsugae]
MAEEKKEPWLNYLALTTVILAVCATLSTFKGGGYSTRSVIAQAQASDQWAYYQAKGIKGNLYEMERDRLQFERDNLPAGDAQRRRYDAAIDQAAKRAERYSAERKAIEKSARQLEDERNQAQRQGKPFGMAVIFLQVAILISSIAGLFKRKRIWLAALPVAGLGLVYFADGFFLFF